MLSLFIKLAYDEQGTVCKFDGLGVICSGSLTTAKKKLKLFQRKGVDLRKYGQDDVIIPSSWIEWFKINHSAFEGRVASLLIKV